MERSQHVFELGKQTPPDQQPGVYVLAGKQSWLRQYALRWLVPPSTAGEDDFSLIALDGEQAQWPDLIDELTAGSLFGGPKKLKQVVLSNADGFITTHRERLEELFSKGVKRAALYLLVDQWLTTTRLAGWVNNHGWRIICDVPTTESGKKKSDDLGAVTRWLKSRAKSEYGLQLAEPSWQLLLELTRLNFGRIDQELCKLSLYFQPHEVVSPERVQEIVGGWRTQTMFQVIDAAVDGKVNVAMKCLDQLFQSGEHPLAMLGTLGWSIRRYAVALEIYDRGPRQPASAMLKRAVEQAGFKAWNSEIESAETRIRRLGRARISQIFNQLKVTDAALKGSHSAEDRGRLAIEKLILWLAAPAETKSR